MEARAYTLREEYDAELFGGNTTLSDGKSFDVGEALKDGGGEIVTTDPDLQNALNHFLALEGRAVEIEGDDEPTDDYENTLKADLEGLVAARNAERAEEDRIPLADGALKPDIIAALRADDEAKEN